jgi:hypothetical protein
VMRTIPCFMMNHKYGSFILMNNISACLIILPTSYVQYRQMFLIVFYFYIFGGLQFYVFIMRLWEPLNSLG